ASLLQQRCDQSGSVGSPSAPGGSWPRGSIVPARRSRLDKAPRSLLPIRDGTASAQGRPFSRTALSLLGSVQSSPGRRNKPAGACPVQARHAPPLLVLRERAARVPTQSSRGTPAFWFGRLPPPPLAFLAAVL